MNFRELTTEQLQEESLINLASSILVEKGQPLTFKEINDTILGLGARTAKQLEDAVVQFYTDINIDGRFIVLGENRWGLREWYAIDQVEEETAPTVKVHDHEEDLELDIEEDDTELVLVDDADEFDATDATAIDHDLDDDEEDDELAGLDVVEEDIDLDEEDDDFALEDEEEEDKL